MVLKFCPYHDRLTNVRLILHSEGNALFAQKKYHEAIIKFTEAIERNPCDVTFFSNRSAAFASLALWSQAVADGRQCIVVDKSFIKGYFRTALALQNMSEHSPSWCPQFFCHSQLHSVSPDEWEEALSVVSSG